MPFYTTVRNSDGKGIISGFWQFAGCFNRANFILSGFRFMRSKRRRAVGIGVIVVAVLMVVTTYFGEFWRRGKPRLPVGAGKPAISLGERHGLILASDGSLWSWGSDFLGWPVLGLGSNILKSVELRRIGHDSNWASISAGEDHNLAVKTDGTLWTWGEPVPIRRALIYAPIPAALATIGSKLPPAGLFQWR
jgi:hypothetical protein